MKKTSFWIILILILFNIFFLFKYYKAVLANKKSNENFTISTPSLLSFKQTCYANLMKIPNITIKKNFSEEKSLYSVLKNKNILIIYNEKSCNACIDSLFDGCKNIYKNLPPNVEIFSVVFDMSIKRFNKIKKVPFTVLFTDELHFFLEIETLPAILLVDNNGKIINSFFINPSVKQFNKIFFESIQKYISQAE